MNKSVAVFGNSLVDINFKIPRSLLIKQNQGDSIKLPFGEKLTSQEHSFSVGGSGANVAVGLSRLGLNVSLGTSLSSDTFSDYIKSTLENAKVDVEGSKTNFSTALSVVLRAAGDRTIITGSNKTSDLLDLDIPDTNWIHLGPLNEDADEFLQKITDYRIKNDKGLSMNPSMSQIEQRSRVFLATLKTMDIVFLNLKEALRLTRLPFKSDIGSVVRSVHSLGVETVCVTDGERGAYVSNQEHIWSAEVTCDKNCRQDATGAGDAFTSGFLAGYLEDNDNMSDKDIHEKSLKIAMLNSGSVVEHIGAQEGLLTFKEIEPDIEKVKISLIK